MVKTCHPSIQLAVSDHCFGRVPQTNPFHVPFGDIGIQTYDDVRICGAALKHNTRQQIAGRKLQIASAWFSNSASIAGPGPHSDAK